MVLQTPAHHLEKFLTLLAQQPGVLVQIEAAQGSVPRDVGTWMVVFQHCLVGTIGGGHLEHEAIARARALLQMQPKAADAEVMRFALGPALGQCCGGVVHARFECVDASQVDTLKAMLQPTLSPVALFGGGHVGHALMRVLSSLPFPSALPVPHSVTMSAAPRAIAVSALSRNSWRWLPA